MCVRPQYECIAVAKPCQQASEKEMSDRSGLQRRIRAAVPHDGIDAVQLLFHDMSIDDGSRVASQQELSPVPRNGRQQMPCRLSIVEVSLEFTLGVE